MESGWLTSGPRVEAFERRMADRAGRRHGIAVCNGTAALDLASASSAVSPGDEVIVPALSYVATASTVALVRTRLRCSSTSTRETSASIPRPRLPRSAAAPQPCFAPTTAATLAITGPDSLGRAARPAADFGRRQSLGATFAGRPALSYGLISTVSFHAAKAMTTVEGGMVFTDDDTLARRMRIIRSQGEDPGRNTTTSSSATTSA